MTGKFRKIKYDYPDCRTRPEMQRKDVQGKNSKKGALVYFHFSHEHKNYFDVINYFVSSPEVLFSNELRNTIDVHSFPPKIDGAHEPDHLAGKVTATDEYAICIFLHHRLSERHFRLFIHLLLFIAGATLL
ncbi:MAG: hypothetical protein ACQERN_09515 [Thermodesulfobacteriota bacterium]